MALTDVRHSRLPKLKLLRTVLTIYYSGYTILLRCPEVKKENAVPNKTND